MGGTERDSEEGPAREQRKNRKEEQQIRESLGRRNET